MNRFAKIAVTGVFAVLTSASVEAQQKGPGQQGQGQPGQKGLPVPGTIGQQAYHGGIGQTPWFSNQEIRQQFKLTDQQYNQLNKSYGESYGRYQQGMQNFGKDLTDEQRTQKMGELHQRFNKDFSTTVNDVFTDRQQRQRYNQLYWQYQGYNAFSDPMVQDKLNLTVEQRRKLGQRGQEWHKQMMDLGRTYQTDREGTTTKFNAMRKQSGEQINTVLTPEQQRSWQEMTGKAYNFQPTIYFQASAGTGAGTTKDSKNPPAPK